MIKAIFFLSTVALLIWLGTQAIDTLSVAVNTHHTALQTITQTR